MSHSKPMSALAQLRKVRLSRTRGDADPFNAFYRIYVTGLGALFGFYTALGLVDEASVGRTGVEWAQERGPLWIALIAAVVIAAGARSGGNGGPLSIDDLELHHVLLSPLDRKLVLTQPTRRLLVAAATLGAVVSAAIGELASRQLPGNQAEWVLAGLLTGTTISLSGIGAALIASGSRLRRGFVAAVAVVAPLWAVIDLVTGTATSPTSTFGKLALWPLDAAPAAAGALAIALVLTGWGWMQMSAMSIERVHHRSRLVRQIRFAMAQQDIRSLLLLRRQLGFETPRKDPWIAIRGGGRFEDRFPVTVRDARSYMRWPASRLARVAGLSVLAGFALSAMWHGTTALIVVVGATLYLAAIEVVEPLGQELDHPGIVELIPTALGTVVLAHVISAVAAMTPVWLLAGSVAAAVSLDWHLGAAVAIAAVPASAAAVTAAALSIKRFDSPTLIPSPEVEGPRLVLRLLWPPTLTLVGALPVLVARNALANHTPAAPATVNATAAVALVATLGVIWIRFRDDFASAATQAKSQTR